MVDKISIFLIGNAQVAFRYDNEQTPCYVILMLRPSSKSHMQTVFLIASLQHGTIGSCEYNL
jgi:hypothetical protein